jgi:hypothetical protein
MPATLSPTSDPFTYLPEKEELVVHDEGEQPTPGDTTIAPPVRIIPADRMAKLRGKRSRVGMWVFPTRTFCLTAESDGLT